MCAASVTDLLWASAEVLGGGSEAGRGRRHADGGEQNGNSPPLPGAQHYVSHHAQGLQQRRGGARERSTQRHHQETP